MTSMWLPSYIQDLTAKAPAKYRIKDRRPGQVDSVVLHQTAMNRGNTPMRYHEVHAHFVIMPNGEILNLHPIEKYLIASSAFNDDAISIEIVGNFPDERGNYWKAETFGKDTLSEDQINSARNFLQYLRDTYGIWWIFAHRQGEDHNLRGNCPGPDVWYYIGEWAVANLQMSDGGKGYTEGKGSPVPDSWRKPRA